MELLFSVPQNQPWESRFVVGPTREFDGKQFLKLEVENRRDHLRRQDDQEQVEQRRVLP
ncbi:MAG: hypothetical protein U5O39_04810 [Gammaproteobacteria bacterium]|nr:hypothetical protein [Gammaproteobacteria bacterium]